MKKAYLKPTMQVVTLQAQGIICGSSVKDVQSGNVGIGYGGGGSDPARARQDSGSDWDDE